MLACKSRRIVESKTVIQRGGNMVFLSGTMTRSRATNRKRTVGVLKNQSKLRQHFALVRILKVTESIE